MDYKLLRQDLQAWHDFNIYYPVDFLDGMASKLGGMTSEQKDIFKDTVFAAARMYATMKYSAEGKTQPSKETAALAKLAKSAQAARDAYIETFEKSLPISVRIHHGVTRTKPNAYQYALPEFRAALDLIVPPSGEGTNLTLIGDILDFVSDSLDMAVEFDTIKQTDTKNSAVKKWVSIIDKKWSSYTDLKMTVGRHDNELGYNTDSLAILEALMERLDPNVTPTQIRSSLRAIIAERKRT